MKKVWIASFAIAAVLSSMFFLMLSAKVSQAVAPNVAVLDQAINCRTDGGALAQSKTLICGRAYPVAEDITHPAASALLASRDAAEIARRHKNS